MKDPPTVPVEKVSDRRRIPSRSLIWLRYMSRLPLTSMKRYPSSRSSGIAWPDVPAGARNRVAPRRKAAIRSGLIAPSLEEGGGKVRAVNCHVTGRAVPVAWQRDVVERGGLRSERRRGERRVALEAQLVDVRAHQLLRIHGAVRLMARGAVPDDTRGGVREDERPALLGVAVEAGQFAVAGPLQALLPRSGVRVVAGRAVEAAAAEAMRKRFGRERSRLDRMTGRTEGNGSF